MDRVRARQLGETGVRMALHRPGRLGRSQPEASSSDALLADPGRGAPRPGGVSSLAPAAGNPASLPGLAVGTGFPPSWLEGWSWFPYDAQ